MAYKNDDTLGCLGCVMILRIAGIIDSGLALILILLIIL